MSDSLKEHLHEAREELSELLEDLEEGLENLAEESREGWLVTKAYMQRSGQKLHDAAEKLEQDSDEMRLQAQLGAMEARMRIEAARDTLVDFANTARQQSRQIADRARLQARLAEMDARNFVAEARASVDNSTARYNDEIHTINRELIQLAADIRKRFTSIDA